MTVLMIAAVIPAIYLMRYVYMHDRLEKEPAKLLIKLVLLGVLSTLGAIITEMIGFNVLGYVFYEGSLPYLIISNFLIIALSEEGFKYLLLKLATWKNKEFNCQFDGVVYAVFVSLGFALWENIQYVFSYGLATALVRAITAVPGHACFGVMMGAWYGLAKKYDVQGDAEKSKHYRRLALLTPVLLHGTYDFAATISNTFGMILFIVVVVVMFWLCRRVLKVISANDTYLNNDPDFTYRDIK